MFKVYILYSVIKEKYFVSVYNMTTFQTQTDNKKYEQTTTTYFHHGRVNSVSCRTPFQDTEVARHVLWFLQWTSFNYIWTFSILD
jgi:hypothetical protein